MSSAASARTTSAGGGLARPPSNTLVQRVTDSAWTYRLIVRFCGVPSRRARRTGVREVRMDESTPARSDAFADADLRDELDRALAKLSLDHRTVVVLHHYSGLPLGEIAEILGVPYGTVGSRLYHATRALRAAVNAGDRLTALEGQPA